MRNSLNITGEKYSCPLKSPLTLITGLIESAPASSGLAALNRANRDAILGITEEDPVLELIWWSPHPSGPFCSRRASGP